MKIFVDVDDTLADFKAHAIARGIPPWTGTWYTQHPDTWTEEQKGIQAATVAMMESDDFWPAIPVKDGANMLLGACMMAVGRESVFLLTAFPRNVRPDVLPTIEIQKKAYCLAHFEIPPDRTIVCDRHEKIIHAVDRTWDGVKPHVLIDDAIQNCEEWRAAGGLAILYESAGQAINELAALLK